MLGTGQREPIGMLAAGGRLPLTIAEKARRVGQPLVCVGYRHMADPQLKQLADRFHWASIARLNGVIRCFRSEGVKRVFMAGKVFKGDIIYAPWKVFSLLPDLRTIRAFLRCRNKQDDTIMLVVIEEFAKDGIVIDTPFELCPELLVRPGTLTRRDLSAREEADVKFGWHLAKKMGELDVGQSVVVKDQSAIAVEAIEGTDRCIQRAGPLCAQGGFVVVKVAKPQQDMRFDVPTIGVQTVQTVHAAGGKVIAIEADKTIVLDQEETVRLANKLGLTIVAVRTPT